jgi:hypothetical protein
MIKNPKNAGRKKKFKTGIKGFLIKDLLPEPVEQEIRNFIENISKQFLNTETKKSKTNEILRGTKTKNKK